MRASSGHAPALFSLRLLSFSTVLACYELTGGFEPSQTPIKLPHDEFESQIMDEDRRVIFCGSYERSLYIATRDGAVLREVDLPINPRYLAASTSFAAVAGPAMTTGSSSLSTSRR